MPRAKKDGVKLSLYVDRTVVAALRRYADDRGQTLTTALERILRAQLDRESEATRTPRTEPGISAE